MQGQYTFNQRDLGHGAAATVLHPIVAVGLLVTVFLMLRRARRDVVVPFLFCMFLVPRGQQILLAGAHLYVHLILVLVGFIRVFFAKWRIAGGLNTVDKLFILWVTYRVSAVIITNWPTGTMEQTAFLLQAVCGYFLLRHLIQNEQDIAKAAMTLATVALLLGVSMVWEHHFQVNPFGAYLGGAPAAPEVRNGTVRAQASFGHSILAGCFGATLMPLFFWLWKTSKRAYALEGMVGSTLMVLTSNSSTPVLAYSAGMLGLLLWPVRRSMKGIRWAIVVLIVGLAAVMNAPVWFVIAHINVIGGSGGYDRAFLIDTCMRHIHDWWLFGTNQNGNWGYDMWDLSDQFVAEAEMGGLVAVASFIAMIAVCFSRLGRMRKRVNAKQQWLLWCLGSIMLANIFAYFGVAYWDQTQMWWFTFLAMIGAVTVPTAATKLVEAASAASTSRKTMVLNTAATARTWGSPKL